MVFQEMLLQGFHILAANMDDLAALVAFAVVAVLFIALMFMGSDVDETGRAIFVDLEFGDRAVAYQTV
jgi:hypothetical protein